MKFDDLFVEHCVTCANVIIYFCLRMGGMTDSAKWAARRLIIGRDVSNLIFYNK